MGVQSKTVPDNGAVPKAGLMKQGAELKTALAAGKLRLFKAGLIVNESLTADLLAAQEADYDGYVAGGMAVTAANDPFVDANGSVLVTLPLVQFNYVDDTDHVSNEIGGAWYEDAAGVPRAVVSFDEPVSMADDSDSIPVVIAIRLGAVPDEA